jgi:hypothetical protein
MSGQLNRAATGGPAHKPTLWPTATVRRRASQAAGGRARRLKAKHNDIA